MLIRAAEQDNSESFYSILRDQRNCFFNWNNDEDRLKRIIDALGFSYLGARTRMNSEIVIIKDAEILEDISIENRQEVIGK